MKDWDALLCEDAADDDGFTKCAVSCFTEGKEKALEKGGWFVNRLLDSHVEMEVEATELCNVIANARKKNKVVESTHA